MDLIFKRLFYYLMRTIFEVVAVIVLRRKVSGRENIPLKGPVIIASNHISMADPPIVGSAVPRVLCFMAKEELFRGRIFGWLISNLNAIPIKRGESDIKAVRVLLSHLEKGGAALVFPEGTRYRPGKFGRPRTGISFLIRQSKATVVPTLITGSDEYKKLKPVKVYFGKAITYDNILEAKLSDEDLARKIMDDITAMYERHAVKNNKNEPIERER